MIFLSSGAVYNKKYNIINKIEKICNYVPDDAYGFYKYICTKFIEETNNNIIDLRLFGVYGKYEDYKLRFISYAICRVILNKPIVIEKNVIFDYLYVNDLVNIIKFFIENTVNYKSYNIGKGESIDLLSIANKIKKISGKENIKVKIKNQGLNNEYTCNIDRLNNEYKIKYTDIDIAIKEMYKWYNKQIKEGVIKNE